MWMARVASLDAIDLEILRIIADDCTVSIKDISRMVKVSPPMVRKRLRRMKSWGLIRGCRADLDPEVLGATSYMIIFEAPTPDGLDEVFSSHSGVERIYASTSKNLGVMIVRISDLRRLDELVGSLEKRGYRVVNTALLDNEYSRVWVPESPRERVQPKCAFCKSPILGKPYVVTLDDGSIVMFNSKECAEAYFLLKTGKGGSSSG